MCAERYTIGRRSVHPISFYSFKMNGRFLIRKRPCGSNSLSHGRLLHIGRHYPHIPKTTGHVRKSGYARTINAIVIGYQDVHIPIMLHFHASARWYAFINIILMKKRLIVQLLHNPGAGSNSYTKESLLDMLQHQDWECRYSSTKDENGWDIDPEARIVVVAGGDGTVRKAAGKILARMQQTPIAVLPIGTANNIATSLGMTGDIKDIVQQLHSGNIKPTKFDTGSIAGIPDTDFFIEGIGFGLFPKAIKNIMNSDELPSHSPEESMNRSLKVIHDTVLSYEPKYCYMEVDGVIYSGSFLMLEIMNIRSVGPKLLLAPEANTTDGQLDIVMARQDEKEKLEAYLTNKMNNHEDRDLFHPVKGKHICLEWYGEELHADDQLVELQPSADIDVVVREGTLSFFMNPSH